MCIAYNSNMNNTTTAETNYGLIKGILTLSLLNNSFYSFHGILSHYPSSSTMCLYANFISIDRHFVAELLEMFPFLLFTDSNKIRWLMWRPLTSNDAQHAVYNFIRRASRPKIFLFNLRIWCTACTTCTQKNDVDCTTCAKWKRAISRCSYIYIRSSIDFSLWRSEGLNIRWL